MARRTTRWDAADSLKTKADIAAYLDAVLEDGDPDLLKAALGDIARAKGMTEIAQATGLGRANLYKALSPDGNPEFATVARVPESPRPPALRRRVDLLAGRTRFAWPSGTWTRPTGVQVPVGWSRCEGARPQAIPALIL